MRPAFCRWYEGVSALDPARVVWEHRAGLTADLLAIAPRSPARAPTCSTGCSRPWDRRRLSHDDLDRLGHPVVVGPCEMMHSRRVTTPPTSVLEMWTRRPALTRASSAWLAPLAASPPGNRNATIDRSGAHGSSSPPERASSPWACAFQVELLVERVTERRHPVEVERQPQAQPPEVAGQLRSQVA